MSDPQLITNWICVATEGQTVDERTIKSEWLQEMADTYDPKYYTALIWEEHNRNLENLGEVIDAKADMMNGKMQLFLRLKPTKKLIKYNEEGQKLFCSIEVEEDFQGTSIFYLGGLAVTDNPASIGTDRLRLRINNLYFANKNYRYLFSSPMHFNLSGGLTKSKNNWFSAISAG